VKWQPLNGNGAGSEVTGGEGPVRGFGSHGDLRVWLWTDMNCRVRSEKPAVEVGKGTHDCHT
jgi:hypothetical protein